MNNYNKPGYSVSEVAQIVGCTPCTVRSMIARGDISAHVIGGDAPTPGKKRKFRIYREQLANYIYENQARFDKSIINQFIKYRTGYPNPDERIDSTIEETVGTPVPTGAWASLISGDEVVDHKKTEEFYDKAVSSIKTYAERPDEIEQAYIVSVNGRIAVGNVTLKTAKAIASLILDDKICDVTAVEIKKI